VKAPQQCPECGVSLRDKTVPLKFRKYKKQFTRALADLSIDPDGWDSTDPAERKKRLWICPDCDHHWAMAP